ncbi:MAG: N-acetylmuramoyl-L-alanine amidase [Mucinivorans sp.]
MVLKFALHIFNVVCLVFGIVMPLRGATTEPKVPIVVIDAGHGGKDPGAVRGSVHEKTINLAVALELGRQLEKLMPRVKIVYTRSDDTFVELGERTTIANEAEADLFVSIHTNSNPNSRIAGTETYVMGADKNSANLAVSMRENGVISLEADYHTRYEGYDPKSSESLIIFSLMQYAYQSQSLALARGVETAYKGVGLASRGVRQAGFLVLWRTAMPSILTEVGFISNPSQLRELTSVKGQKSLASALAKAIKLYVEQNFNGSIPVQTVEPVVRVNEKPQVVDIKADDRIENISKNTVTYSVQIKSSSKPITINSTNFGPLVMQVKELKVKNIYKYCLKEVDSYKEALLLQSKLRKIYQDAFVVAFCDGEQISVGAAKQKSK